MSLKALLALGIAGAVAHETVHGVVVFTRHGDRTTKWYGSQQLTSLGAQQNFQVGSDYRSRYLSAGSNHQIRGISEDKYVPSQVWASAPDQGILSNTATAFLQGLYPPLGDVDPELAAESLANGSASAAPLDGYQYVLLHGVDDESPDTIWIKGDDACPAYVSASKAFAASDVYAERVDATREFYEGLYDVLSPDVYNLHRDNMTYANAYNIFDLVNVARVHNETSGARNVSDEDVDRLRYLADSYDFGHNYNASQPDRAIGGQTLAGAVLNQLNQTVSTKGKLKFSLMAGSYDTFLAFFGLSGLADTSDDFKGLPDYASTMAFELFSDSADELPADGFPANEADLRVRYLFRNGTAGELTSFRLFGSSADSFSWSDFKEIMGDKSISSVGTWCDKCSAAEDFCAAYAKDDAESSSSDDEDEGEGGSGGMSNAVAGVIGAMVTLGVLAIVGALAFVLLGRRKGADRQAGVGAVAPTHEKNTATSSVRSGSTDLASRV